MSRKISCHHTARQLSHIFPPLHERWTSSTTQHTTAVSMPSNNWKFMKILRLSSPWKFFYFRFYDPNRFCIFPPIRALRFQDVSTILSRCDEGTMNITRPTNKFEMTWRRYRRVKFYVVMARRTTTKSSSFYFILEKFCLFHRPATAKGLSFDSFLRL